MTKDEELEQLRAEKTALCEALRRAKTKSWNSRIRRIRTYAKDSSKPFRPLWFLQEQVKSLEG